MCVIATSAGMDSGFKYVALLNEHILSDWILHLCPKSRWYILWVVNVSMKLIYMICANRARRSKITARSRGGWVAKILSDFDEVQWYCWKRGTKLRCNLVSIMSMDCGMFTNLFSLPNFVHWHLKIVVLMRIWSHCAYQPCLAAMFTTNGSKNSRLEGSWKRLPQQHMFMLTKFMCSACINSQPMSLHSRCL